MSSVPCPISLQTGRICIYRLVSDRQSPVSCTSCQLRVQSAKRYQQPLADLLPPISIHVGLVVHSNPPAFLPPNMIFGKGCCGIAAPAGSVGPGTMVVGILEERRSLRRTVRVLVGWEVYIGFEVALNRFCRCRTLSATPQAKIRHPAHRLLVVFAANGLAQGVSSEYQSGYTIARFAVLMGFRQLIAQK